MIKQSAVLFDMDGLMLDTERPFITHFTAKAREYGWEVPFDVIINTIGIDCNATGAYLREKLGGDFPYEKIRNEILAFEEEEFSTKGIPHRPGLEPLLDVLEERHIPFAVATSTGRERAVWKLTHSGLMRRFSCMVCGDEIQHGKPAPDIFLCAARKLGIAPAECIGFEDSPAGLRSLAAAGIRAVFIKDMIEPPPEILAAVWKRYPDLSSAIGLFTG